MNHAIYSGKAEDRPPAEHDGLDFLNKVSGNKEVGLACTRSGAAHIHSGNRSFRAEHDGDA
jgi:hypothetical protein